MRMVYDGREKTWQPTPTRNVGDTLAVNDLENVVFSNDTASPNLDAGRWLFVS